MTVEDWTMFDCPNCTNEFMVRNGDYESKHRLTCPHCNTENVRERSVDGKLLR